MHVEPGGAGKRQLYLTLFEAAGRGGTSLFTRNPRQTFQSVAVPLWGSYGKRPQISQEPEDRKSQRPHPVCSLVSVFNSFRAISASPPGLVLEGAASSCAWKPMFNFPRRTNFRGSTNPGALMLGVLQVFSLHTPLGVLTEHDHGPTQLRQAEAASSRVSSQQTSREHVSSPLNSFSVMWAISTEAL